MVNLSERKKKTCDANIDLNSAVYSRNEEVFYIFSFLLISFIDMNEYQSLIVQFIKKCLNTIHIDTPNFQTAI